MTVVIYGALYLLAIVLPLIISIAVTRESIIEFYKNNTPQNGGKQLAPFFFDPSKNGTTGRTSYHIRERACNNCIVFSSYDMEETEKKLVELLRITNAYKYKE